MLQFFDSGAGPVPGPYGAVASPPRVLVPLDGDFGFATDGDPNTSLSLPRGSFVTLGFASPIYDGDGPDIFVTESGPSGDRAFIWAISASDGALVELGEAGDGGQTGFDLAGKGLTKGVSAVKVQGLDLLGDSPGFDLAFVSALQRAAPESEKPEPEKPEPETPSVTPVPAPAPLGLAAFGVAALLAVRRRK